jgi:hypothetical protein
VFPKVLGLLGVVERACDLEIAVFTCGDAVSTRLCAGGGLRDAGDDNEGAKSQKRIENVKCQRLFKNN